MVDDTPERPTDIEGERLDEESGVGIGGDIKSTEEPAEVLPDDPPDHRSGLQTEDSPEDE